jgi:putative phosphoesterase
MPSDSHKTTAVIGIVSDTHGFLAPQAAGLLQGVDYIIHAGDIGSLAIVNDLRRIAPVYAVRGNMDGEDWSKQLPPEEFLEIGTTMIYVIHDLAWIDMDLAAAHIDVVIHGHLHRPLCQVEQDILWINPGSASYPRHHNPPSLALLNIAPNNCHVQFWDIEKQSVLEL